jgi:hypothetical protein
VLSSKPVRHTFRRLDYFLTDDLLGSMAFGGRQSQSVGSSEGDLTSVAWKIVCDTVSADVGWLLEGWR